MLNINLPESINNRLELLSLSTGRSMQFYVHEAIMEYIDELETRYTQSDPTDLKENPEIVSDELENYGVEELYLE